VVSGLIRNGGQSTGRSTVPRRADRT